MRPGMFREYAESCPHRIELETPRRPVNALNVEVGTPAPRCAKRIPEHWSKETSAIRWLWSGGSPLVFGRCGSSSCPLKPDYCECGHRAEFHIDGICRVTGESGFPCGCEIIKG